MRPDIQALRAFAILSVLVYHLWPTKLDGGYIGVDIFFVISGYLITGQLWRQVERNNKVNFADFWARRARRLLPASLLVIATTAVATFFLTPKTWFLSIVGDIFSSTFYVQNWLLASKATDYLQEDAPDSPFIHFWSLSVEEQYYVFWPIVMFAALWLSRKAKSHKETVVAVLAAIFVGSFAYSIYLTATLPELAYFSTFTRAWEFAAGAMLSVLLSGEKAASSRVANNPAFFWVGLALMTAPVFLFDSKTPFPSFWAAIPVLGAVLVLFGGQSTSRLVPRRLFAVKPIQFVGDISYSLYLWHMPLIILAPWILYRDIGNKDRVVIFAIAVVLGWLSKRFVEDPVRFGKLSKLLPSRQLMVSAVGLASVAALAFGSQIAAADIFKNSWAYNSITPTLDTVKDDKPAIETDECRSSTNEAQFKTCVRGVADGSVRVALIGDSHARQYYAGIEKIALANDWQLTVISKSACPLLDPALWPSKVSYKSCKPWNIEFEKYLAKTKPFDLVINSSSSLVTQNRPDYSVAYKSVIEKIVATGAQVVVIADNPKPLDANRSNGSPLNYKSCLETATAETISKCAVTRKAALEPADGLPAAVAGMPGVSISYLVDLYCSEICLPVIDGILVYRDHSHITNTFAEWLAPYIEKAIPREFLK